MFRFRRASVLWHDRPLLTWNRCQPLPFQGVVFLFIIPPCGIKPLSMLSPLSAQHLQMSVSPGFSLVCSPDYWLLIGWYYVSPSLLAMTGDPGPMHIWRCNVWQPPAPWCDHSLCPLRWHKRRGPERRDTSDQYSLTTALFSCSFSYS